MDKLTIKPYDPKLSENLANIVIGIMNKHTTEVTPKELEKIKKDIIKMVDRKVVLYQDYEEDVQKAYKRGLSEKRGLNA